MRYTTTGILAAALAGLAAGCGGGNTTSTPPPPPPPAPVAVVELTGPATVLEAGTNLQLVATAKDGSGATLSGLTFSWSSSAPAVATVSAQGLVLGVSAGAATITATTGARSASLALTVRDTTSLPTTLSGRIDRVNLTLAAGQTYRVTGDLVMYADSSLKILGNVELDPGVTAIFFSSGTLDVTGDVGPAPAIAALRVPVGEAAVVAPTETVFGGQRVNIGGNVQPDGPIYVAGANTGTTNLSLVTIGPGAFVTPQPAPDGTPAAKDGQPGYALEIGTTVARNKLGPLGQAGGPIRRLRVITSTLKGGNAGQGYRLTRADGIVANNRWEGKGGNGGKGGLLAIQADELEMSGGGALGGAGGDGGTARLNNADRLLTGSGPNGEGESLFLETGSGGDGGDLDVAASQMIGNSLFSESLSGVVQSLNVSGGNGDNGGAGGDLTIRVGEPGGIGRVTLPAGVTARPNGNPALPPPVVLLDVANGGHAMTPGRPGGAGGIIKLEGPVPLSIPKVSKIFLRDVAKGGRGFNGCSLSLFGNGTDGGPGGRLLSGGAPLDGGGDFDGGRGGDGLPNPGGGGSAGTHLGNAFGLPGAPGNPCPVLSVAPISVNINSQRPVGTCIDNGIPAGNIQILNLITAAPTSYTVSIVNLQGASGIGVIPGLASIGQGVPAVSGTAPPSGQHIVWYDFDPCAARDGGGNAKAEFRISALNQTYIIPITVTMP